MRKTEKHVEVVRVHLFVWGGSLCVYVHVLLISELEIN